MSFLYGCSGRVLLSISSLFACAFCSDHRASWSHWRASSSSQLSGALPVSSYFLFRLCSISIASSFHWLLYHCSHSSAWHSYTSYETLLLARSYLWKENPTSWNYCWPLPYRLWPSDLRQWAPRESHKSHLSELFAPISVRICLVSLNLFILCAKCHGVSTKTACFASLFASHKSAFHSWLWAWFLFLKLH